jgi:putative cardiolipin synthase
LLEDAGRIDVAHDPFARGAALSAIFSDAGKRRERRRRRWRRVFIVVLVLFVAWCLLAWSSRLPVDAHHEFSRSQVATDSPIALALAASPAKPPGTSGILALPAPIDAFATRVAMVRAARRTLDLQYYIWNGDRTGLLLLDELRLAADRGVRVRLLVDDNGTAGMDATLQALDAHPNVEVRIFNPFVLRRFKSLGLLVDFDRLNRRMHNKSLTVDGLATIVGGRNIGDPYFDSDPHVAFVDLDVLAVGEVAGEVGQQFDKYWNSTYARSAVSILGPAPAEAATQLAARLADVKSSADAARFMQAVDNNAVVASLQRGKIRLDWVPVLLAYDPPSKVSGEAGAAQLLVTQLTATLGNPATQLDVISPYFVPGKQGLATFCAIAQRGVPVRIVTNSLAANDVVAVHSGYAKWRRRLLECGVTLYELKPTGEPQSTTDKGWKRPGNSSASLHGKVFAMDRARAFVGSFNLDPRSVTLNTEMGFVVDSPALAGRISTALDQRVAGGAYEVRLGKEGKLQWIERVGDSPSVYNDEPDASASRAWAAWLLSKLPIEHLL